MLDRCLYAFEMAWHHSFSIASANCMLDPERSENKGFLEALFRQLQVLSPCCLSLVTPAMGAVLAFSAIALLAECHYSTALMPVSCDAEAEPPRPASPCTRGRQAAVGAGLARPHRHAPLPLHISASVCCVPALMSCV